MGECKHQNYILKITLDGVSNPTITRKLPCPANATFEQFHLALQKAFGFSRTHTYDFKAKDPNAEPLQEMDIIALMNNMMAQSDATEGLIPDVGPKENLLRIMEENAVDKSFIDGLHDNQRKHGQTPEKYGHNVKL